MKKLSSAEIRQLFIDFYKEKGHTEMPSASLVPVDDPTLLWINSGVAALKKYFDGSIKPENPRLVNSQKSIRTNDIENVGITARHHTLFEMLGNFSIGDYFKEEAIPWAWEFLTSPDWMGFDPDKLYVTVYPDDEDAKRIWIEKVGLPVDRLIDEEGNFWDLGAGPCGPNSEIFYDRGQDYNDLAEDDPESYPGGENERWLEIWNLVFSEFNHLPDDSYEPLPNKNIDAGMGLERMASITQDAETNYETDLFLPIIEAVEKISGLTYRQDESLTPSFRIIADHIRAVTFAISDGALPSNEGRGYVIRRLLRRAMTHGRRLGLEEAFLSDLVPVVRDIMVAYYPELNQNLDFVQKIVSAEEDRFLETIEEGSALLNEKISYAKAEGQKEIPGQVAFQLYDTYGFPLELTQEFAQEAGLSVDLPGFEREMDAQKERARSARSTEQSMHVQTDLFDEVTEETHFEGYENDESRGQLLYIIKDGQMLDEVSSTGEAELIFDRTPFYAEMGGQVGDTGLISQSGHAVAVVEDTQKAPGGQTLHQVDIKEPLKVGETYELSIHSDRRVLIRRNHTATHLLHQALKDVLGKHVNQAGSLVAPDLLRFDFSHFSQVSSEELLEIEERVNQKIWQAIPLETIETDIDTARDMGALALFGEKYGQEVRIVKISDYSIELCGGTHVANTSEIGLFKIISESGIGAGTRRIVAKVSEPAFRWMEDRLDILDQSQTLAKTQVVEDLPEKIQSLQAEIKDLKAENASLQQKIANQQAGDIFEDVKEAGNLTYIASEIQASDMNQLRQLADQWKQAGHSDVLVLALVKEGKVNLLAAANPKAIDAGVKAGDLIKDLAKIVGGGGGGRPDMAQAGGKNPENLDQVFEKLPEWLEEKSQA